MILAVAAYGPLIKPARDLPAQKRALRKLLAGPVSFHRQCGGALFGWLHRFVKDAACFVVAVNRVIVFKVLHARNNFLDVIRDQAFAIFRRRGFFAANNRKRSAAVFLRHGDGGCGSRNQNKASNSHCDFATGRTAHDNVSLALILCLSGVVGRGVSRAPLIANLPGHCAEKRDQMWDFLGALRANSPQFPATAHKITQRFLNASSGDRLRRVAHHDGLAYVRRNPIFDGDTAR